VSGSGTEDGLPCFNNADCSVNDYPTIIGSVSGTVSGNTISLSFSGTANGGVCAGQSSGFSFTGTLVDDHTISGVTGSGKSVTYTKP
jgi:hypothetical protein